MFNIYIIDILIENSVSCLFCRQCFFGVDTNTIQYLFSVQEHFNKNEYVNCIRPDSNARPVLYRCIPKFSIGHFKEKQTLACIPYPTATRIFRQVKRQICAL